MKYTVAICYDFDGTLSPKNMQEYGFFSGLGDSAKTFWQESRELALESGADPVLAYMKLMIDRAKSGKMKTTKSAFRSFGKTVQLYAGVDTWFKHIKDIGASLGLNVEHYIVSSGLKEMIEGTSIGKEFKKIYACSFIYDQNGVAEWPAVAVNYTTKTQFLFRINKGIKDDNDHTAINAFIPEEKRRVPFSRMIYLGDGETDIPSMSLVKRLGGTSIAVYPENSPQKQENTQQNLADTGRVNYVAPANYRKGAQLERLIRAQLEKIAAEINLLQFNQ